MQFHDVVTEALQGLSYNKLSKILGVTRQAVSDWDNKGIIPKDETLDKLAAQVGMPVEKLYFIAYAEKIENPVVAEKFRHLAA